MSNKYVEMGLSAPVNVTWEVTYSCNLSCIHCLSDSGNGRRQELTTDECKQVIDSLATSKVFQLNIGGGEPLLRPDFLELVDYAHDKGIVTCISTNGTLVDSYVARRLAHPLVYIQVSIDGATAETNDAIRGKGSYEKALNAVSLFREQGIKVSINTVLTRLSFSELDALTELAARFGAKLRVSRFRPAGRGKENWSKLNPSAKQLKSFSEWLGKHLQVSTGDSFFSISDENRRSLGLNMCGACKLTCCISPEGYVFPCAFLQDKELIAGKLPEESFSEIWNQSNIFNFFRELEVEACQTCPRFDLCHGGCPAIAYHLHRKLGIPDIGCLVNCIEQIECQYGVKH